MEKRNIIYYSTECLKNLESEKKVKVQKDKTTCVYIVNKIDFFK